MQTAQQLQPVIDVMINVDQNAESPGVLDESQEGYNPFQIPANLAMAKKHGKAKRVYVDPSKTQHVEKSEDKYLHKNSQVEACKCCGNPVEGEMIPVTAPLKELYHLGSGYPLYFRFIKYSIAMLFAMLLVSGIYNLVTNIVEGDCISQDSTQLSVYCLKGYILSFTLPNKRDNKDLLTAQLALNLATVVVIMIFFHYLRYQFRKTEIAADDATITPSDYTIEIENVDPNATNKEIKQWIMDSFATPEQPLEIERIVRPYAINKYMECETKVSSLKTQKNTFYSSHHRHEPTSKDKIRMETIDAEIQFHEAHKEQLLKSISKANLIFVTFRTAQQSSHVVSKFKRPLLAEVFGFFLDSLAGTSHSFKGNRVQVRRAPEPSDVLWSNLGYTKQERNRTRIFSNTITLLMIVISFGIIILVNWAQGKAVTKYGKDSSVVQGLSIVASLVIVATNSILALLIDFLANYEKHYTYTHYLRGVAQKLAIAQFLNTALTNLFAEFILASSDTEEQKLENGLQSINIYGKGGLLENIYWVFITNAFLTPALAIFDPMYILKRVQQFFVERKEAKGGQNKMTQRDAHILYEGPVLAMPTKYAGMIKMVLLATFYAPALPFALIYTIPGLILWYWADKYVLLRRNAKPKSIDDDLADSMVEYLEFAACTFAAGNIMYTYTLKNQYDELAFDNTCWALIWVTLGISLFHIIFPMEALNRKLFHIEDKVTETLTFEEARLAFNPDYDIANPLTHAKALRDYFRRLQTSKDLTKSAQVKKLVDKGIFGKLTAENFNAIMSPQNQTPVHVEHTQVDQDEDEIDLNGLADYAKHVEQQKAMSTNNGNIDQGAPLGTFFNRVEQDKVNGGEALRNLFGKLPEAEPLNGDQTDKPLRKDSNHNDDQAVNDVVGNFFGGNMMNKEVYQDDEPVQGEWNNLFTSNGPAINNINSINNKLPEREKEVEEPNNGRTFKTQDSANIQVRDSNEDSNGNDRNLTVSRRIIPKSFGQHHQN